MNPSYTARSLIAPISGQVVSLDQVPDPVFSERMTGDGLAILAEDDEALAPCDGTISLLFETKHAFAITTEDGVQILVHIGLDTVILNGKGIEALYKPGDRVTTGTPILRFDFDLMLKKQIDLISPLIIVNYDKVTNLKLRQPGEFLKTGIDTAVSYTLK